MSRSPGCRCVALSLINRQFWNSSFNKRPGGLPLFSDELPLHTTAASRFTFTFICPLGKTHNHRSRGDTPWVAQTLSTAGRTTTSLNGDKAIFSSRRRNSARFSRGRHPSPSENGAPPQSPHTASVSTLRTRPGSRTHACQDSCYRAAGLKNSHIPPRGHDQFQGTAHSSAPTLTRHTQAGPRSPSYRWYASRYSG